MSSTESNTEHNFNKSTLLKNKKSQVSEVNNSKTDVDYNQHVHWN